MIVRKQMAMDRLVTCEALLTDAVMDVAHGNASMVMSERYDRAYCYLMTILTWGMSYSEFSKCGYQKW